MGRYFSNIKNFNIFHDNPNFIGGKVGLSGAASDTLISIFDSDMGGVPKGISPLFFWGRLIMLKTVAIC